MRINVTEARSRLPELIERVSRGEEVTLTRHGAPVAVLVKPEALRPRRAAAAFNQAEELHHMLEEARDQPLSQHGVMSAERAEELIAAIRRDRDEE